MIKDGSSGDPSSIKHLYNLSNKNFRDEILRKFKKFKEANEQSIRFKRNESTNQKTLKNLKKTEKLDI